MAKKKVSAGSRKTTGKKRALTAPKGIPWDKARNEYVTTPIPITLAEIAKRYDVAERTVELMSSKQKWTALRKEFLKNADEKFMRIAGDSIAAMRLEDLDLVEKMAKVGAAHVLRNPIVWKPKDIIDYMRYKLTLLGEPDVRIGGDVSVEGIKEILMEAFKNDGAVNRDVIRRIARRRS